LIQANDFVRQWREIQEDVNAAVAEVGSSGWYILGRSVRELESALAGAVGRGHAIGCANGLDAIEICLRCLDLLPGQKVLTTPNSAFATTLAIVRAGGVPVFVDVDEGGNIDLSAARRCLESDPSIRFLVPVHLFGHALDLDELESLRNDFDLRIVEDAAQALGAAWGERPVGSIGQMTATSFYPTKNLGALGDGGAAFTDAETLATRARALGDYGQRAKYEHAEFGLNSRLDELHAAILRQAMMPRWPTWTQRRQAIAELYLSGLDHPLVKPLPFPTGSRSVWHLFPVRVADGRRDALRDSLKSLGIQALVHYPLTIPDQPVFSGKLASDQVFGGIERARLLARSELSLPIHPQLFDHEVERVIEGVNSWRP
jgi:dTDP-3-amino-3,4,6-trideoxy-alpha-D-glucose transaminase